MTRIASLALMALLLLGGRPASAQNSCLLDGRSYPENAVVCSAGLVMYCSNGSWQNDNGRRCDASSGSYLTPLRPFEEKNREPIPEYYRERYPELGLQ